MRALSVAADRPYLEVHGILQQLGRQKGKGTPRTLQDRALRRMEVKRQWTEYRPKQANGNRYTLISVARDFPKGRYLVYIRHHVAAMVDGVIYDWSKGRRHRVQKLVKLL